MALYELHRNLSARFTEVQGLPAVDHYGDAPREHASLTHAAGLVDLSFRGRFCLTGQDRQRFLNGQVTNNVKDLTPGQGCYAAVVNHKGKLQGDMYIHALTGELLLDFEPGQAGAVKERLEEFIIADDVQLVDVAPFYGLLSVQGPRAAEVTAALGTELGFSPPTGLLASVSVQHPQAGECCVVRLPRTGTDGFDWFVPLASAEFVAARLLAATGRSGGMMCGWQALEMARLEAGLPRYGVDMDETNLAPEAGLEARAIRYDKGCYTGQEVIARIRTYGSVARALRGLRLADDLPALPRRGDKLWREGREVGYVTSAVRSLAWQANLALGYVRKECNKPGTALVLKQESGETPVLVEALPFRLPPPGAAA